MSATIETASTWASAPPRHVELALNAPRDDADGAGFNLFGEDGFTFADAVDIVNPLQHLPFISTFYRNETGDDIAAAPRVMGSTLFFGPIGLVGALANIMVEESTGQDIGEHVASWFGAGDQDQPSSQPQTDVASIQNAVSPPPANDPVIAWARAEMDWAKKSAARTTSAQPVSEPASTKSPVRSVPDASPLLRQEEPWAAIQEQQLGGASMVHTRHAANAYAATAALEEESFG